MIGVVAKAADLDVVAEFFELFKTPWQLASPHGEYEAVLVADDDGRLDDLRAPAVLIYRSHGRPSEPHGAAVVERVCGPVNIRWKESEWPVYGDLAVFGDSGGPEAVTSPKGDVESRQRCGTRTVCRIGYDLFDEARRLLTEGQPRTNAAIATLEMHIALLRERLQELGASFVEVPARPHGYDFFCCLTHDVDFFGITRHRFDRTIAGFAWRASIGTAVDLVRGRRTFAEACRNWRMLGALPLTYVALARDFWDPFESYAAADRGRPSTFFLIPFRGRAGVAPDGTVKPHRAVSYAVGDIGLDMQRAAARGNELGLHGIDAWRHQESGRAELAELHAVAPQASRGVRMHWLFFDSQSPRHVEQAGFEYDSTCGYNDAIGHRAGTAQAFALPGTTVIELPLSIMDTAMFYRDRMGLALDEAVSACRRILANVRRFGGALVINWHDRSLEPERLWRRAYDALLDELENHHHAWFATAQQAVAWFRWRRAISFSYDPATRAVTIDAPSPCPIAPAAAVMISRADERPNKASIRFDGTQPLTVSL